MKGASVYSRMGWAVVPLHDVSSGVCSCSKGVECPSAGKHPRLREWQREATSETETVAEWSATWPEANVGIATGTASGFFVLDIDRPEALEELGEIPHTVMARTGSGGTHYLFRLPDFTVSNSASKIAKGVDVRGDGGQIVVAPSVSARGPYKWINAPFNTQMAYAPEWLLSALKASTPTPAAAPAPARSAWPAATQEVLEQAAEALERHGPAIEGKGGDQHTFIAGSILSHDFALTFDEAWPLFCEWNEGNEPPWSTNDLAAKLKGASKYAKGEYGVKRSADAITVAKRLLAEFPGSGRHNLDLVADIKKLRFRDNTERAFVARELRALTSMTAKELELPPPAKADSEPTPSGTIEVTPRLSEVADLSILAIQKRVFQRSGILCEVAINDTARISDLETARVLDLMSAASRYVRRDHERQVLVEQVAPVAVAQILHARRTHPNEIRKLEMVTTAPIFLADGSILQEEGYNEQARVWLQPSVIVDVLENPTRADARAAVELFEDLLSDFNFLEPADFSTWLAAVLSPLVKSATANAPAPLFCVSAASPGAGKTLLTDLIAKIVTGGNAEVRPYNPKDPGEWGKRLTAFVKAASSVSVFDNANGPIGDEGLDRLITSSTWSDRILGASDAPPLPNVTTWLATGNNIEPVGDTVRRSAVIRIDVNVERPHERTDFVRKDLGAYVLEHRAEFLSAALTILRAYQCAKRPAQNLASWGSFGVWSELVRGALVWVGLADPWLTNRRQALDSSEPENEQHDFWLHVIDRTDGLVPSIVTAANQSDARTVLNLRDEVTAHGLRKLIARFVDKPRSGRRIRRDRDPVRFYVEKITSF